MAPSAQLMKTGSLSRITCSSKALSAVASVVKKRLMREAFLKNETGSSLFNLNAPETFIRKGKCLCEGTEDKRIVATGFSFFAISVATMPPMDKPMMAKGLLAFIFCESRLA